MNETYTLLQKACINNDTAVLKTIIALKQNINANDELFFISKQTIKDICRTNNLYDEIIDDLTSIDILPETVFVYATRCTAMHIAAYKGHNEILEILLAAGADPNVFSTQFSYTPLYIAVAQNNFVMTKKLLDSGANPNIKRKHVNSLCYLPLHAAAGFETANMAKLLLEYGANPNVNASFDEHCMITVLGCNYRNEELFNLFFYLVNEQVLASFFKCICDNENMVSELLDKIPLATLVRISKNHENILGYASREQNKTILLNLIAAGAMPNKIYILPTTCALTNDYSTNMEYNVKLLLNNYCPYRVTGEVLQITNNNPLNPRECSNCGSDITVDHSNRKIHRAGLSNSYFCGEQQVSSLQEIARYHIRKNLVSNNLQATLKQATASLPLPTFLKNYIYSPL